MFCRRGVTRTPIIIGISLRTTDSLGPACAVFARDPQHSPGCCGSVIDTGPREQAAADHHEHGPTPDWWRLALVGLFFLLYVGLEIGFAGWIATYSDELGLGSGWATGLTAAFWAGFLGGRLAMVWRGDNIDTGNVLRWSIGAATVLAVAVALSVRTRSRC